MAKRWQTEGKVARRSLLRGIVALGEAAAVTTMAPAVTRAVSKAPALDIAKQSSYPITASTSKNIVETDSGRIYGYSHAGVIGYRGIPYGATTAGSSRFMPPRKPNPWTGVRSALYWSWVCPQTYTSTSTARRVGWTHDEEAFMFQWDDGAPSEDCLRLNVWTPATDNTKRPVLFWIHGGGYTTGSSHELATYDGENLARRGNVVVVSVNHRLGPLGFLNLSEYGEQYAHSSNTGILDLVAALEWVRVNIGTFGGDAGNVTIFGQSGGGGKVAALMGMPAASGLFHRAVIQSSGSGLHQIPSGISLQTTAALLNELAVGRSNLAKLHQIANEEILEASVRIGKTGQSSTAAQPGFGGWGPVVDGHDLPRQIWNPAAPDPSAKVPLLIGTVLNEMANSVQMGSAALEDMPMNEVKQRLAKQFPITADALIDAISKAHAIRKPFDIYAIAGGLPRRVDALTMATRKAEQGQAPVFMYKFVWQSPVVDGRARAYHCSELPFVFYNTERCSAMTGGGPVPMELAGRISDAWIGFARTGNPSHPGLPQWTPFSKESKATMVLSTHCELKIHYDDAEVEAARNYTTA